jgi:hypothetical protein
LKKQRSLIYKERNVCVDGLADDTFGYDGFIWWDTLPHLLDMKKKY